MNFYVLTLFTEMIENGMSHSIIGRAIKEGKISVKAVDIRDFSTNKHNRIDDYPYGGGCGMVIQPQPVYDAYKSLGLGEETRVVYMTPQGKPFTQAIAEEFSKEENLVILCGHYEGIDQRVIDQIVTDEISMGDFVLTGGEIPAMAVIDAVSRLKAGVLGKEESFMDETFSNNTLEYPQYTRPATFMDKKVPDVLLSGNHANVDKWRRQESLKRTYEKRPDLFAKIELTKKDLQFMKDYKNQQAPKE
ncbi:MAG: tRNA (guanosine(37)-N1)-methyltransferase TrmD [Anaerotignaceae bacterium]